MQVFCASGVEEVSVSGRSYRIGADGAFQIDNESDVKQLVELGHAHRARPEPVRCAECAGHKAHAAELAVEIGGLCEKIDALEAQLAAKQSKRK